MNYMDYHRRYIEVMIILFLVFLIFIIADKFGDTTKSTNAHTNYTYTNGINLCEGCELGNGFWGVGGNAPLDDPFRNLN